MLYKIIMNKKWQKIAFIIAGMLYIGLAFLAFSTFKKLDWYKDVYTFFNENYYHVFQVLGLFVVLRAFFIYKEEHDDYSWFEIVMTFIYEHAILAAIFVFVVIDYRILYGSDATNRALLIRTFFYFLLAASQYHYKEYLPFFTFASAACMITTIICQQCGIIIDAVYHRTATEVGYSMGYIWPLTFQAHFLIIVIMYLTVRRENITIFETIILFAANIFTGAITTAKTGMYLTCVVLVLAYIIHFEKVRAGLYQLSKVIYAEIIAIPLLSVVVSIFYDRKVMLWRIVNRFLNNRLMLQHKSFYEEAPHFFGQNKIWVAFSMDLDGTGNKDKYNFVDNSFIKSAYDYGIGFVLILIIGFVYIVHQFAKEENYTGILCVGILFIFGIMQHQALLISINPFLLTMAPMFMVGLSDLIKKEEVSK